MKTHGSQEFSQRQAGLACHTRLHKVVRVPFHCDVTSSSHPIPVTRHKPDPAAKPCMHLPQQDDAAGGRVHTLRCAALQQGQHLWRAQRCLAGAVAPAGGNRERAAESLVPPAGLRVGPPQKASATGRVAPIAPALRLAPARLFCARPSAPPAQAL